MPKHRILAAPIAASLTCAILAGCGSGHTTKAHQGATTAAPIASSPRAHSHAQDKLKSEPPRPSRVSTGRGGAPLLISRRPPPHGGLYQPTKLTTAIQLAKTKLKDPELRAAKITPQYLQLIATNGQTITIDAQNRISSTTTPFPVGSKGFPLSELTPTTPARIIANTHVPWQRIAYLQLGAMTANTGLLWQMRPTTGRGFWTAQPDGTHLAHHTVK